MQKRSMQNYASTHSATWQEFMPKLAKPLWLNSKPCHIHILPGSQFCKANALLLLCSNSLTMLTRNWFLHSFLECHNICVWVRQIKEKAIRRLRHTSRSKLLKTYLG
ncbi:MAG: hypothetical protein AB9846_09235 [Tenuifilaceae bacterium]